MRKLPSIFTIVIALISTFCMGQEIPKTEISNGLISATVYLPHAKQGYYRATRFDWSGVIPHLEHNGHTYFGQWFQNYDPLIHESVMGPVDEFSQFGYEEASAGETFLKIGVGTLIKPPESRYNKFKPYKIKNGGIWKVTSTPEKIVFKHTLIDDKYAYDYEKQVVLVTGKSEMILHHTFTNNSKHTLKTQVYNHNFFLLDDEPIGEGYAVLFPHKIEARGTLKGINEFARISNDEIIFTDEIPKGKQVYIEFIEGFNNPSNQYEFSIENRKTGAGVQVVGNSPLAKMAFWSAQKTVCPEPYINIEIKPRETIHWKITYRFYSL